MRWSSLKDGWARTARQAAVAVCGGAVAAFCTGSGVALTLAAASMIDATPAAAHDSRDRDWQREWQREAAREAARAAAKAAAEAAARAAAKAAAEAAARAAAQQGKSSYPSYPSFPSYGKPGSPAPPSKSASGSSSQGSNGGQRGGDSSRADSRQSSGNGSGDGIHEVPETNGAFQSVEVQRKRYEALMRDLQRHAREARAPDGDPKAAKDDKSSSPLERWRRERAARDVSDKRLRTLYDDLDRKAKEASSERLRQIQQLEALRARQAARDAAKEAAGETVIDEERARRFQFVRNAAALAQREKSDAGGDVVSGEKGESVAQKPDEQKAPGKSRSEKKTASGKGGSGKGGSKGGLADRVAGGDLPSRLGEMIATDLSPQAAARIAKFGIVRTSERRLPGKGVRLSRLKLPKGMSVEKAQSLLTDQMPLGTFHVNYGYHIFTSMKGPAEGLRTRRAAKDVLDTGKTVITSLPAEAVDAVEDTVDEALGADEPAAPEDESAVQELAAADSADETTSSAARQDPLTDSNATKKAGYPAAGEGCRGNTCFPRKLIRWTEKLNTCAKDVRIGIIDTSFDVTHPSFTGLKSKSGHFLDNEAPSPYDWHGTAVLSLLAGDAASGTPGLVPDATYYLATAFETDQQGNASTDTARLLEALNWLDELGVDYVNMSFSGPRDPMFENSIQKMQAKGVVFVAAAGNQGPTAPPSYPAAYPQVVAVTAVNNNMENYRYANRGDYVDVSAPGVEIWTALPDRKEGYRTGTSFAAPFVTAVLAASKHRPGKGGISDFMSRLTLRDLGPPGRDPIYGRGLVIAPKVCGGAESEIAGRTPQEFPPRMAVGIASRDTQ